MAPRREQATPRAAPAETVKALQREPAPQMALGSLASRLPPPATATPAAINKRDAKKRDERPWYTLVHPALVEFLNNNALVARALVEF